MNLQNHIEAVLFLVAEPIEIKKLAEILGQEKKDVEKAVEELEVNLQERGLVLVRKDDQVMLGTAPESSQYCEKLIKEELDKNMGKAGLETLAIILYKGEVGKADIDYIRGVNSAFSLRSLMIKGLIERKVNPQNKRSYIYSPSIMLFQHLGISKKEDLPDFEKFVEEFENVDKQPDKNS